MIHSGRIQVHARCIVGGKKWMRGIGFNMVELEGLFVRRPQYIVWDHVCDGQVSFSYSFFAVADMRCVF
jgi:hypothetical protein